MNDIHTDRWDRFIPSAADVGGNKIKKCYKWAINQDSAGEPFMCHMLYITTPWTKMMRTIN